MLQGLISLIAAFSPQLNFTCKMTGVIECKNKHLEMLKRKKETEKREVCVWLLAQALVMHHTFSKHLTLMLMVAHLAS